MHRLDHSCTIQRRGGHFTPESPSKLLQQGKFAQDVNVILSHAVDEGGQFTKAFKEHKTTVEEFVDFALPDATPDKKQWILATYDSGRRRSRRHWKDHR